jgi:hypothetical protein
MRAIDRSADVNQSAGHNEILTMNCYISSFDLAGSSLTAKPRRMTLMLFK